eukprot:scaffold5550_cov43-Prasinocladus_malaysianus.AAC.4
MKATETIAYISEFIDVSHINAAYQGLKIVAWRFDSKNHTAVASYSDYPPAALGTSSPWVGPRKSVHATSTKIT